MCVNDPEVAIRCLIGLSPDGDREEARKHRNLDPLCTTIA